MAHMHIVKRAGHEERFDERKVYASCYAACVAAHIKKTDAERICEKVAAAVKKAVKARTKEIDSNELFMLITAELKTHDKNAAYMYRTHRDIS